MPNQRIGILHPGEMGIFIASSAKNSGCDVYWTSEGRRAATRERAYKFELHEAPTLIELCEACPIVVSVCPPHAAETLAAEVVRAGFRGLFVEANAIAPERTIQIGQAMTKAGVSFVDGGIIGLPSWKPHTTCLYLSGDRANEVVPCFSAGPLDTSVLGTEIGKASALKMCYAANTKGAVALLAAILATAESQRSRGVVRSMAIRRRPAPRPDPEAHPDELPEGLALRRRNGRDLANLHLSRRAGRVPRRRGRHL